MEFALQQGQTVSEFSKEQTGSQRLRAQRGDVETFVFCTPYS